MSYRDELQKLLSASTPEDRRNALDLATRVADDGVDAMYTAVDFLAFLRGDVPPELGVCPNCGFPGDDEGDVVVEGARH